MSESLDIMAPGAADQYEKYLNSLDSEMEERLEELRDLSAQLDEHDKNRFTSGMDEFIQSISNTAGELLDGICELTKETLLAELKAKNEVMGSARQEGYINQIEAAAGKLQNHAVVPEADLTGDKSFTEDDMDQMAEDFVSMLNNWKDSVQKLIQEAADIAGDSSRQDELSGAYAAMESQLRIFATALQDATEQITMHQFDIKEGHVARKQTLTQKAGDHMSGVVSRLMSELEEKAGAFGSLEF